MTEDARLAELELAVSNPQCDVRTLLEYADAMKQHSDEQEARFRAKQPVARKVKSTEEQHTMTAPYKPNVLDPTTQALWDAWADARINKALGGIVLRMATRDLVKVVNKLVDEQTALLRKELKDEIEKLRGEVLRSRVS